jgi:hypothetical protein
MICTMKRPKTLPRIAYDAFWGKRSEVQVFPFKACAQEWKDAVNAILEEAAKTVSAAYSSGMTSAEVADLVRNLKSR